MNELIPEIGIMEIACLYVSILRINQTKVVKLTMRIPYRHNQFKKMLTREYWNIGILDKYCFTAAKFSVSRKESFQNIVLFLDVFNEASDILKFLKIINYWRSI